MSAPGELPDDLPPLVGADGVEVPDDLPPLVQDDEAAAEAAPAAAVPEPAAAAAEPVDDRPPTPEPEADDAGVSEEAGIKATVALQAAAALEAAKAAAAEGPDAGVSAEDAIKQAMSQAEEPKKAANFGDVDEKTLRMITAISRDDFEECEDAILQGANVNVDCGAGMHALHISALRGEIHLTELLIAHGAKVNQRDLSGNTPLLYACHFYRQHQRGVQVVSQLLYHKADAHYRVKDGKLAGRSAHDIMDKACSEPNTDENVPRQMRAMLQLAMDGEDSGYEAITKVWMSYKSQNKKLYSVSSKKDNYDYLMKNIAWVTPANAKNVQAAAPVKLEGGAGIEEERFIEVKDYLFNDEGEKVKVYVTFPAAAEAALAKAGALEVGFEFQSFDVKLRAGDAGSFRAKIEPLFGSIDVEKCKHRISAASRKVTLTLVKRHTARKWTALQKDR